MAAGSIVVAHNHPSRDATPSCADRSVTAVLRDAANRVGITLVDHVVVTPSGHFSREHEGWT